MNDNDDLGDIMPQRAAFNYRPGTFRDAVLCVYVCVYIYIHIYIYVYYMCIYIYIYINLYQTILKHRLTTIDTHTHTVLVCNT